VRVIRSAAAVLAATAAVAAVIALTPTAAATTTTPWDENAGLVFMGGDAELPTVPNDVWSALHDRTIAQLGTAGEAVCLGYATNGQAGIGTKYETEDPAAVTTEGALAGRKVAAITSGGEHTCAVATPGKAYCWGSSTRGQVGSGTTKGSVFDPTSVDTSGPLSGKTIVAVTAGLQHSCALASNGRAYCWGRGTEGQLGDGRGTNATRPVAVDTSGALSGKTLVAIDAGSRHTCAVASDGGLYCWGRGRDGQLGYGARQNKTTPAVVTGSGTQRQYASVSAGMAHTCAVDSTGDVFCWGEGANGRLGTGTTADLLTPPTAPALDGYGVRSLAAGDYQTCTVTGNRDIYCWGYNREGQLATGDRTNRLTPSKALAGDLAAPCRTPSP
jgi:alpha-tubulin suppressor-like RCC1 family protein